MAWIEMSRKPDHRPQGWSVGECLWSPQRKADGAKWGFWESMLAVKRGDVVFHLCGEAEARFTGFSVADENGQPISQGPDGPDQLYRVGLRDYTELEKPIFWDAIRIEKRNELLRYFQSNKLKKKNLKERLFYVLQSKRVQCLNGAYLSYLSDDLAAIIFKYTIRSNKSAVLIDNAATVGTKMRIAATRVGQQKFAENVKSNFANQCCYPGCSISDPMYLIGSHIARWADASELRGLTANGLCFCVFHDRAFEVGSFTFDKYLRVKLHKCDTKLEWVRLWLLPGAGKPIKQSEISPTLLTLKHHWERHEVIL